MRLIIEDLEGSTTVVNLESEEVTIGRKPHNTIQLTEQNVSRSHAKLLFQEEGWLIQDLGSYNGVKVNGVPIAQPTVLRESDLIQIGDYHLTLTDNADRATVDIERPRPAANDNIIGMSSSANLPSISVEDLEPMRPSPVPAAPPPQQQEERNNGNKAGMIMGIIGILLAAFDRAGDIIVPVHLQALHRNEEIAVVDLARILVYRGDINVAGADDPSVGGEDGE